MYSNMAALYDELMGDVDYKEWYLYMEKIFHKFNKKPKKILEMACGTGNISYYLAKNGYDLTCFDISPEMLSMAYNKLEDFNNIKFIKQNMIDFKINKKFDAVISVCDSINYVLDKKDLLNVFKNANNHLNEDGVFIFDINSYYKLKHVIGNNTFIEDRNNIYYTWQNYFDDIKNIGEFYLTFFIYDKAGRYKRVDEQHFQKAYQIEEIKKLLYEADFKKVHFFDEFTFNKPMEESERINFIALN